MHERILVVDDEADVTLFCSKALTRLHYKPETAQSGQKALEILKERPFDLLLTDIMMPGMNGLDLLQEARKIDPQLTAVVITGFSTLDLTLKAFRAGARDFLPKPFSIVDLREAIENALAQARIVKEHTKLRSLLPLFELTKQTLRGVERETLCTKVMDIAMDEANADGAALLLIDDTPGQEKRLKFEARRGTLPLPFTGCLCFAESMSDAQQARILTLQDDLPEGLEAAMRQNGLGTLMCSPLRAPSHFLGILALTRKETTSSGRRPADATSPFQQADIEMVSILSSLVAALFENTRLVTRLEDWNGKLEVRVEERTRELKEAQEHLLRAERLATIGQLGASIAHELRNPLGVMNNSVYYLGSRLGKADPKISKHLDIIGREVKVANNIIADLMNFVRVGNVEISPADPALLVRHTLERALLPDNVHVRTEFGQDMPPVRVDAEKTQQVFINLINNAAQAMPDGGEIAISAIAKNGYVQFSFSDTGIGIPPENLERIFDPLFTTKARGIGLGLAIVRMLIEAHHGEIKVSSQVGKGSCFTVRLPSYKEPGDAKPEEKVA